MVEGEAILSPAVKEGPNLTLSWTSQLPLITQQEVVNILHQSGVKWEAGTQRADKTITLTAIHGLATFGHAGDTSGIALPDESYPKGACANWLGPCPLPIIKCTDGGICGDTGRVHGRLEKRPMWIIDYGNMLIESGGSPLGQPSTANHIVYWDRESLYHVLVLQRSIKRPSRTEVWLTGCGPSHCETSV